MQLSQAALSETRVLVFSQDPALVESVRRALSPRYRVTTCASSLAALSLVESGKRFDVVVGGLEGGLEFHDRLDLADPVLARSCLFLAPGRISASDEAFVEQIHVRALFGALRIDRLLEEVEALAERASRHREALRAG